jgi:PTH1 family peptidyl-tRNA hydrolase
VRGTQEGAEPVDAWVVVGLGNPGPQYARNRHNVGQMTVDELARRTQVSFRSHRSRTQVADARLGTGPGGVPGPHVVLAKSTGYMNLSGGPVASLLSMHGGPDRLMVVHDDLDIPFGQVRLKLGGGEGGHNGLRSISAALGTKDYIRVRVGIGRPPGRMDPADYVLRDFSAVERRELPWLVDAAADAVEMVVTQGLAVAQQRFHSTA